MKRLIPRVRFRPLYATAMMSMLQTNIVLIKACGSLFVLVGHRLEPPRSIAMHKFAGDAATTLGMVE